MREDESSLTELLKRTAQGDEGALTSLYDATSRRVFGLALKILGDASAAEEATIEVYAHVWGRASQFDPARGRAMTWLLTVARSRALDMRRAGVRRGAKEVSLDSIGSVRDPTPGPETVSICSEQGSWIRDALARLSKEQREAIETAYFLGLSHSEVAEALGEPLGTIKTRIRTGLSALRRHLAEA